MGCTRAPEQYRSIIEQEASANGLDPNFLEAVCIQEGILRWPNNVPTGPYPGVYLDTGEYAHGPMAIHLSAALGAGFAGPVLLDSQGRKYAPTLADPANSIKYGAIYLAKRGLGALGQLPSGGAACEAGDMACLAAAYTQGNTRRRPDGSWLKQEYVNNVKGYYECLTGRTLPDERHPSGPIRNPGQTGPDQPTDPPPTDPGSIKCIGFRPEIERIIPFPMPSLPYFAYFTVAMVGYGNLATGTPTETPTIDDKGKQGRVFSPPRPQYITRFEMEEKFGGQNKCYVRVFDPNWDFSELVSSYEPGTTQLARISFGYVSQEYGDLQGPARYDSGLDLWSPEYAMRVWSFHPEFLGWGVEVEMVFFGIGGLMAGTHQTKQHEGKRVDEIVTDIAKQYNADVCTVPTKRLLVEGGALQTASQVDKPFLQDESDWSFASKLSMEAVQEDNDVHGDYNIWVDDAAAEKAMFHFHSQLWDSPPIRQYTYLRSQYGNIIEWRPDIQDIGIARLGGARADQLTFDPGSKEFKEKTVDLEAVVGSSFTGSVADSPLVTLTKSATIPVRKKFPSVEGPVGDFQVEGVNFFEKAYNFAYTGTLIILGDPLIRPGRNVVLLVFTFRDTADGQLLPVLNFTSGVYNVQTVRHVIEGGQYLTVLSLRRNNGGSIPDDLAPQTPQGELGPETAVDRPKAFDTRQSEVFFNTYPNNMTR